LMKTPYIAHLTEEDYEHVYEPAAEDSFILLDALEQDVDIFRDHPPSICVEIGSGSGVVSTFLAQLLSEPAVHIATDINRYACLATAKTGTINNVNLEVIQSNLVDSFRLDGKIDILMFNPPYVPTSSEELASTQALRGIGGAWAGGETGMSITDEVIKSLQRLLAPGGRFYLVAVEQNRPLDIVEQLKDLGLDAEVVLRRRAGRELLYIIRGI
ncbi:S-adenosyl-L-methionine-dependent methyltransferase, partial [Dioszegia hungarica]